MARKSTRAAKKVAAPKEPQSKLPATPAPFNSTAFRPVSTAKTSKAKPKSIKDRILFILKDAPTLLGLPTIKKRLVADFGMTDSKAFNTNVKKALWDLATSGPGSDFGQIQASYHGGPQSPGLLAYRAKYPVYVYEPEDDWTGLSDEDLMLCCHCHTKCGSTFLDEDSVSRGCMYRCCNCRQTYWTWISDGDTHPVEYALRHGSTVVE